MRRYKFKSVFTGRISILRPQIVHYMKTILGFLRLIRWKNLAIVLFAQLLIWYCVVLPLRDTYGLEIFLNEFHFSLFCLSTMLLAAAGYIINDYFDIRIDLRNRPEKVIIGKSIKQRWALFWHSLFNLIALLIAAYLVNKVGKWWLMLIPAGTTILLWVYSTHFKRMFLWGNLSIALLTALSLYAITYEPSLYPYFNLDVTIGIKGTTALNPFLVITVYTFFAFMLTWVREIVKDMEDFKGDAEEGCVTMPIKLGLQKTTYFTILLSIITLLPLAIAVYKLWIADWKVLSVYMLVFLVLPLIYFIYNINSKHHTAHYERMSKWLKWLMLFGIVMLPVYYFSI